ncbi:hypothetical protein BB558_000624 [Smittium angustum]|uniref:Thioredoxin domain-containing protein n=1 Tax=Smittium angustum TaxID=133377 RepID=A0A2U1JDN8_SMIAN|nr:hypothetical protein BB558_000624 [Smittium angustum]
MRSFRVDNPLEFDNTINYALGFQDPVFVLFFGRELPETGVSYCPDCVKADPIIREALSTLPEYTLVEVPVDRKTMSDSPTLIYRTREDIKLTAVPTLAKWTNDGMVIEINGTDALGRIKDVVVGGIDEVIVGGIVVVGGIDEVVVGGGIVVVGGIDEVVVGGGIVVVGGIDEVVIVGGIDEVVIVGGIDEVVVGGGIVVVGGIDEVVIVGGIDEVVVGGGIVVVGGIDEVVIVGGIDEIVVIGGGIDEVVVGGMDTLGKMKVGVPVGDLVGLLVDLVNVSVRLEVWV